MPNPLGRRRADVAPVEAKEEISKLKEELNDLRKMYIQDMASVGSNVKALLSQLSSQTEAAAKKVNTPVTE